MEKFSTEYKKETFTLHVDNDVYTYKCKMYNKQFLKNANHKIV